MSKIERYTGNLQAFGSAAQGAERTLFGETSQANDLTSQITSAFLRGWGFVGPSENPSMEDFNAAMYTMSQFIAYQHQMGIPEWDALQEYYSGSICVRAGETYSSLVNGNVGSAPPSVKWTPVLTTKNGLENLGLSDVAHLPQLTGVVGASRNAKMSVTAASATATFTADELIVQTALGGLQYKLSGFSKTINLATTGAGGMDTGTVPATGFVALYAIYNPTTQASALLAVNATSVAAPEICAGVMPAGYTASALVSVWGILASKFVVGNQIRRQVSFARIQVFNGSTSTPGTPTVQLLSLVGNAPLNAVTIAGSLIVHSNAAAVNVVILAVGCDSNMSGYQQSIIGGSSSGGMDSSSSFSLVLVTPSTLYYTLQTSNAVAVSGTINISSYEF
ncbi:hypothetical protein [Yersinia frederiksenii]|uniref:hypothetical protein n=1 Tax=Yersinia frederiksenii TaxID=29484 RepID=UPI0005E5FD6A|nr:hypothetical protein [Yersinia frederiksenii]CNF53471.1 tail fiber protein [Yersinia frederiksenii]